jgi:hypothetical protein
MRRTMKVNVMWRAGDGKKDADEVSTQEQKATNLILTCCAAVAVSSSLLLSFNKYCTSTLL